MLGEADLHASPTRRGPAATQHASSGADWRIISEKYQIAGEGEGSKQEKEWLSLVLE